MKKVDKPWGWYIVLDEGPDYVIKKIYISPLERFSLQKHMHREEYWHILSGYGLINIDSKKKVVYENESFYIKKEVIHRLQSGKDGITFIEVQRGECDEDDIIRLQDDYNRVTE